MHRREMKHRPKLLSLTNLARVFIYFTAAIILVVLDNVVESVKSGSEVSVKGIYTTMFSPTSMYPWTSGLLRKAQTDKVAIVTLTVGDNDVDLDLSDFCNRREYLAEVIDAIKLGAPKGLVIDYVFGKGQCTEEQRQQTQTRKLQAAIKAFSSLSSPVVWGQDAYREEDLQVAWPSKYIEFEKKGFNESDLLVKPLSGAFGNLEPSVVRFGLVQLNSDYRKIPLSWLAFRDVDGKPTQIETLAVAAARSFTQDEGLHKKIDELENAGRHPFTSFAKESEFLIMSASSIVNKTADLQMLTGRIVLIAVIDPEHNTDIHETLFGKMPGVVLQANYIESLVDGRFLRPVDQRLQIVIALIWFVVIDTVLRYWRGDGWLRILYPLLAIVVLWIILALLISWTGRYIELLFPSIFVLVAAQVTDNVRELLNPERKAKRKVHA